MKYCCLPTLLPLWTVLSTLSYVPVFASEGSSDLIVSTQHGPVRGTIRRAASSTRDVYSFFGVPYARSPDYSFRFFPPYDPWAWSEVKDATDENAPFCRQDKERFAKLRKDSWLRFVADDDQPMKEDCLTVNVFSPVHPRKASSSKKLPVMIWIHGGSFQTSATSNRMWMLPAFEDVVLVTVNYRLGVFGFLSLGDKWAPGNTGLYDQVKAFEWVRNNVANFGGDPELVTIIGNSAGAFSVSAHTLSPLSRGLFHRVVAMSGAATLPSMWKTNQRTMANEVAERGSCLFHDNSFTATCLRNHLTSSELVNVSQSETFVAEVDGKLFPSSPEQLIADGQFAKVPMLIGGAAGEFDFILARKFFPTLGSGEITRREAERLIGHNLAEYHSVVGSSDLLRSVVDEYLGENSASKQLMKGVADFYADSWFNWPSEHLASRYKESYVDVFMYKFAPRPSFYRDTKLFPRPFNFERADHTDGVVFMFGFPFLPGLENKGMTFTQGEKELSRKMMKVFATFAKTGKPETEEVPHWRPYPSVAVLNQVVNFNNTFLQSKRSLWEEIQSNQDKRSECISSQLDSCL